MREAMVDLTRFPSVGGWRMNPNAITSARQAMNGFNRLALNEVRSSMRSARFGR